MTGKQLDRLVEEWDQDADPARVVKKLAGAKPVEVAKFIAGLHGNYDAPTFADALETLIVSLMRVGR
jgi:hypothetical protein